MTTGEHPFWWAAALFALALALRALLVVTTGFDGLYGQDAYTYWDEGLTFGRLLGAGGARGAVVWPNGFPLLVGIATCIAGPSPAAAQGVSLMTGALLAPVLFLLTRSLVPERPWAAIWAGLMGATAGELVRSSIAVMSDATGVFWATTAAWCLVRTWQARRRWPWLVAAALLTAMAVITRWSYALLAPAFAGFATRRTLRARWPRPAALLLIGFVALAAAAPQIIHSMDRPRGLLTNTLLVDWSPANAWRASVQTIDGPVTYDWPSALVALAPLVHPAYLFPAFGLAAVVGLIALARDRRIGAIVLLAGWWACAYVFLAGLPLQSFRFGIVLVPPTVVLAGIGLATLSERPRWRRGVVGVALIGIVFTVGWGLRATHAFTDRVGEQRMLVHEIAARLPAAAVVLASGLTASLTHHHPDLEVWELGWMSEKALAGALASSRPVYLAVVPEEMAAPGSGRTPRRNVEWLRAHATLREAIRVREVVVYEIVGSR